MKTALQRSRTEEARVVPIVLRPCSWQVSPIGRFQMLPTNSKPITYWHNEDEAFHEVVRELRRLVTSMQTQKFLALGEVSQERTEHIQSARHASSIDFGVVSRLTETPAKASRPKVSLHPLQEMSQLGADLANQISNWSPANWGVVFLVGLVVLSLLLAWLMGGISAFVWVIISWCLAWFAISTIYLFIVYVLGPLLPKVFVGIGHLCAFLHWYNAALWMYERALSLKPQLSKAYRGQSKVYKQLAQRESTKLLRQAQRAYKKARQLGVKLPLDDES